MPDHTDIAVSLRVLRGQPFLTLFLSFWPGKGCCGEERNTHGA